MKCFYLNAAYNMNTPTIKTDRLILRKFLENDIEALFLILKDKEVNKFLPWYSLKDIEETKKFYAERYAAKYEQPQAYAYAICLKDDNFPIGYVKVDMEEHHDFGYGLRKEFWHRGIASEAGKAVVEQVKKFRMYQLNFTKGQDWIYQKYWEEHPNHFIEEL